MADTSSQNANSATNQVKYQDRTIFDFRTRLSGGGARSNLFECEMTFPDFARRNDDDDGGANQLEIDFRFLVKAAQLPGSTINTIPVPFRGRTLKIAGDRTYDPWTITVLNDTNFRLRNAFERWSDAINNNQDNSGLITPSTYQKDIIVRQLSRGTKTEGNTTESLSTKSDRPIDVLKTYVLYGCYPSSIDPIPLSYDSSDSIEEYNVTFEVQWWDAYKGDSSILGSLKEAPGSPSTGFGYNTGGAFG